MVEVYEEGLCAVTRGLFAEIGAELALDVSGAGGPELLESAKSLALFLGGYFESIGRAPEPGETTDWASSLLISQKVGEGRIGFDEFAFDGVTIRHGVVQCAKIWSAQSNMCHRFRSDYRPSRFGQLIAVSPGLLEGTPSIEGVRYAAPDHMTGWWLFAEGYDGAKDEFKSMKTVHVFDVIARLPNVAAVLGLNVGFAFRQTDLLSPGGASVNVWFEGDSEKRDDVSL